MDSKKQAGCSRLKTFWDKLIIAAAMSSCAMGMAHCGESAEGFTRLQKQMDDIHKENDRQADPNIPKAP